MRSWAYNCFGVLMGASWRASGPRWPSLMGDILPMITLFPSQGDFCATADNRRTQHLVVVGDRPVSVHLLQTRRTVNRLGGKISRTIECQEVMTIQKRQRFKRLASLHLPKDTLEQRTERLRGERIEYLAHVGVAGHTLKAVNRFQIALGPFLIKSEQRR